LSVVEKFGDWLAEKITPQDIESWLASHDKWADATKNRYLSLLKLTFRLAEVNGKITFNPARLVRMRRENNARVRYLNQHAPLPTKLDYLKACRDEESRLRAVIAREYASHLPELHVALNCGLRRGEQYGLEWRSVNFERRLLTIPRCKNGETRHVPLNAMALGTFKKLLPIMETHNYVFVSQRSRDGRRSVLRSSRHWFEDAVSKAGIRDFHWHDLRHTFASRLVMAGVDLRTVQEVMGHKAIAMTARYAHLAPAHILAAVERLGAYDPLPKKIALGAKKDSRIANVG
jgi:site-specific recombinase XerD